MSSFISFITQHFEWLAGFSVLLFIATLILVPALAVRIPEDYFCHSRRQRPDTQHPILRLIVSIIKNALGALLLVAGLVMLLTPGQGLLTLLVGLMIMNYPGKYRLEAWLVERLRLLKALNWFRRRYNRPELIPPSSLNPHSPDSTDSLP